MPWPHTETEERTEGLLLVPSILSSPENTLSTPRHLARSLGAPTVPAAYLTPGEDPTGLLLKSGILMGEHWETCSKLFWVLVSGVGVENQEEKAPGASLVGRATWLGGGGQPTPIAPI